MEGSWRSDGFSSDGIRSQSRLVVGQSGDFVEYDTRQIEGQKHSGKMAGTLCISNDWLIFTITNDFTTGTVLPRAGLAYKIVGFGPQQLSLVNSNWSNRVDFFRESNVVKAAQNSTALQQAKGIKLSSVKLDKLPLKDVITLLRDESVKRDKGRKGITISLGPDEKQLEDVEVNLDLRDVTLAEAIVRVADSVGLDTRASDTEILLVRKKAK